MFQSTVNVAGILNNTVKIKKISVCVFTILLQIKTNKMLFQYQIRSKLT